MVGKAKKTVSLAYKEKLLAEIAHYEKRIEEALNRRKLNSFEDESIEEEDITNPYKLNPQTSLYELKLRDASLSNRASKTLELGMLTVMQSEVNIMVTPPEVRKPVPEDGVWYEVAAECKIDLVSFSITFYAHKPHRKFAPTRYRNLVVLLVKTAHENELAQSILPKLRLPNLAMQVLQSYATASRSRRTSLLELAEQYEDKLSMQALPEGGYRVRFLDLLQVEWTLENLWSPIVPFYHRMKFEVEYMPKDYIQAIGKLYKQFKDPSLVTSERTLLLSKIFDICLQAAGPARELQESFESDPETTGRLHERRTTIDQEPDVPPVERSPKKKEASGKENKPHNRKTSMAPPKTIPKKAKKSKHNDNENRKSVKRAMESESGNVIKKSRIYDNDKSKNAGLKGGRDGIDKGGEIGEDRSNGKDVTAKKDSGKGAATKKYTGKDATSKKDTGVDVANNSEAEGVSFENNPPKTGKVNATNTKETDSTDTVMTKRAAKSKGNGNTEDGDINNAKRNKEVGSSKNSVASAKGSKKEDNDKIVKSKDNTENNVVSSKKSAENMANAKKTKTADNIVNTENNVAKSQNVVDNIVDTNTHTHDQNYNSTKNTEKERVIKKGTENTANKKEPKKVASAKKDEGSVASSKQITKKGADGAVTSKEKNVVNGVAVPKSKATNKDNAKIVANTKDNNAKYKTNTKNVHDANIGTTTGSKTVASNDDDGNINAASNNLKDTDDPTKKVTKNPEKESNVGKKLEGNEKNRIAVKKPTQKDSNTAKQNEQGTSDVFNKNSNDILTENKEKNVKQTEKAIQKGKVVKEKPIESNKATAKDNTNKENGLVEKRNVTSKKSTEQTGLDKNKIIVDKSSKTELVRDAHKTAKYNDILAKKSKTAEPGTNIKNNNGNQLKNATTNKSEKPNNNTTRILKENTNRDETEKNVDKHMSTKNHKNNMLNVTITKSKIIPLSKLQTDKQIKIADKLKTKIPMKKSKMTFSSLGEKLKMNNLGKISKGVEKTKIPQKSLPVFKKVAKNIPTRISPRKIPSFKPSNYGFSNK